MFELLQGMGDSEMDEDDSLVRPHTRLVFCGKLVTAEGRASMVSYKVRPLLVPQEYDIFKKEAEVARFYYEKVFFLTIILFISPYSLYLYSFSLSRTVFFRL